MRFIKHNVNRLASVVLLLAFPALLLAVLLIEAFGYVWEVILPDARSYFAGLHIRNAFARVWRNGVVAGTHPWFRNGSVLD